MLGVILSTDEEAEGGEDHNLDGVTSEGSNGEERDESERRGT